MKQTFANILSFCLLLSSLPLNLQAQQREQSVKIGTAEVQLDIVVKDKKGKPVKDLKAGDFEVFEDNVKQQIESFRLVARNGSKPGNTEAKTETPATPPATTPTPDEKSQPGKVTRLTEDAITAVALVFDRLSPDSRRRAQLAAQSYLGDGAKQDNYAGVFLISQNLATLQNYTIETLLIRKAIDRAASSVTSSFDATAGIVTDSLNQSISQASAASTSAASTASAAGAAGGAGAGTAGAAAGAADTDRQFLEMQLKTKEAFDVLQRNQQGFVTVNALMAVVNSMQRLPGRKAVMFFSEGVAIPPNVQQQFRSVIDNANRANVSIYAVDSAGLRAESTLAASRSEIEGRAKRRMDTLDQAMNNNGPLTAGLERNEDLINLNPQNGLMQLAQETGGQYIGDTNNIAPKLKQIDEDLNTYYLISYTPVNQNYDGKFRNISLKLKRSGVDAQSRKGYYAVNTGGGSPVLFYETPALAALSNGRTDNAFPIKSINFNFPEPSHLGRTAFEIEMPANAFTFTEDKSKKTYASDFSVVALVKDENKQIVRKLSTHYTLSGALDQLQKTKNGLILFYREEDLPPGKFEVEVAAHDLPSNKISIRKSSIEIPEADESKLRLSSIALVKRGEQLPKDQKSESPFLFGNILLYPNLGEPISKSSKQLGFFFTVYPAKGSTFTPLLTVDLLQNGNGLASVPLKLPAPTDSGKIPYVGNLPLASLLPGEYELRASVRTDKGSAVRTTKFTLVP